jgi:heptosyltransferase-1
MNILIVRLGALGDIVHTVPAAAALRAAFPGARIDWLVDARHREMVELVTAVDTAVVLQTPTLSGWVDVVRRLRSMRYDVALDFQGLLKSAVLARASGAPRVIGFSLWHLREKTARPFYTSGVPDSPSGGLQPDLEPRTRDGESIHVIHKNLHLLRAVGIADADIRFPLAAPVSAALNRVRIAIGDATPFALINPGAAWPNKRWPPERFGEVATFLQEVRGIPSIVLWGPDEEPLARRVVEASAGTAHAAPPTTIGDLLALSRAAALMLSGDTGPLHIAAAAGTPIVALFGPTDPARNGPWSHDDVVVSRHHTCECHYDRRCHHSTWCVGTITVTEVTAAVQQRLTRASAVSRSRNVSALRDGNA